MARHGAHGSIACSPDARCVSAFRTCNGCDSVHRGRSARRRSHAAAWATKERGLRGMASRRGTRGEGEGKGGATIMSADW